MESPGLMPCYMQLYRMIDCMCLSCTSWTMYNFPDYSSSPAGMPESCVNELICLTSLYLGDFKPFSYLPRLLSPVSYHVCSLFSSQSSNIAVGRDEYLSMILVIDACSEVEYIHLYRHGNKPHARRDSEHRTISVLASLK